MQMALSRYFDRGLRARVTTALCLAPLLVALTARPVRAMGVRETSTSLAKSTDGKSELFEDDASGPEGGGSIAFHVTGDELRKLVISSDFSPGDGTRPQSVPADLCRARLGELKAVCDRRGFSSVSFHPDVCSRPSRVGAVTSP